MMAADARPIWIQLVDEFRRRIVGGQWAAGDKIPSVRELALDLGVNPNTVQRALTEIDRLGLTQTARATGRYVTTEAAAIDAARLEIARAAADQYVASARSIGLTQQTSTQLIAERWPANEGN
ncbi:MAG: GntR family transcriptional regulator [Buchananella hordeovulneris]|nr:GntR family transcriptional regulator [Buchananella hordeovulneris]MDO5080702.1 GntR family transcriptional regulator [Buchananella hordeovulneris]RRD42371.1 GntR family transcriptional regulator [Buchananella hordeovulneris]